MAASKRTIVIGHGDEPALLERNIEHHLSIGFDAVVVATAFPDGEADDVARSFAGERVVTYAPDGERDDPFLYFDGAARFARERFTSERLAFVDTDELIVCRNGTIEHTAASDRYDLVLIARHNVVLLHEQSGALATVDVANPLDLPVFANTPEIFMQWLSGDTTIPYVEGQDAAKLYARGRFIDGLQTGTHGITTYASYVTRAVDDDLAIVHFPFTTFERFEGKVARVARLFREYGHRFRANESWHWRHWASLDEAGIRNEFERQIHDAAKTYSGRKLTTLRALFDGDGAGRSPLDPYAWHWLERAVGYFPHAYPHAPLPPWFRTVFNPDWYAGRYPDVRECVAAGIMDVPNHYLRYGASEGRSPSATYDAAYIRERLEERTGKRIDPRDVFWLYFDLEPAQRPSPNRFAN